MDVSASTLIAGRYRADQRLGSGAMGEVWSGTHVGIGNRVAIKRLLPAGSNHHESVARFKREAQLLGRIQSDYVARVLDFVEDKTFGLVLVMELVDGATLYDLLNQRKFSVEEAVEMGCDILNGLCDLHEAQIVHRDMKPGNIIVEKRTRGRTRCRLVDFGMSRVMSSGNDEEEELTGITRADVALGTLDYMAPEQVLNSRGVTGAADVYAAGIILYRAVMGRHAYRAENDALLVRAKLSQDAPPLETGRSDMVARGFAAVVAKALQRKPQDRYATAEEMLRDLEVLRDQVTHAQMADEKTSAFTLDMASMGPPAAPPAAPQLMEEDSVGGPPVGRSFVVPVGAPTPPPASAEPLPSSQRPMAPLPQVDAPRSRKGVGVLVALAVMGVVALGAGFLAGTVSSNDGRSSAAEAKKPGPAVDGPKTAVTPATASSTTPGASGAPSAAAAASTSARPAASSAPSAPSR